MALSQLTHRTQSTGCHLKAGERSNS